MKLSTITWLSKTIALPLFMGILNILPAGAEQIARSRSSAVEPLPSVTDLNLLVPVTANPLPLVHEVSPFPERLPSQKENRLESSDSSPQKEGYANEPIWSNPNPTRKDLPAPVLRERNNRTNSTTRRRNLGTKNIDSSTETTAKAPRRGRSNSRQDIAAISRPPLSGNYLRLVRDPNKGTNNMGNPIYTLEAYVRGERYQTFTAVSGTARSQNFNRNRGNNSAPLPDGSYNVSSQITSGQASEVGRTFVAIYPTFQTGRTDLGIHLDRSFNQQNGFDGTAGCIGIATVAERDAVNEFVSRYHPRNLFVKIES
jgi:hypothetical protein